MAKCKCGSGKEYRACCQPYHRAKEAETPEALLRSRYSAYANHLADYIVRTTHPASPYHPLVAKEIQQFCRITTFEGLEILVQNIQENEGWITFTAHLKQGQKDISFTEKSYFTKVEGAWRYHSGSPGNA